MHGLATLVRLNRKRAGTGRKGIDAFVSVPGRTNYAPPRPRAGAKGVCPSCKRNVGVEVWNGDCARCEPQED